MDSHYCRKRSTRKYLPSELNVNKMYLMYTNKCSKLGIIPAKECAYRRIFKTEFNLHFHVPKKDQYDFCTEYWNTKAKSDSLREKYDEHHTQKELARQAKNRAKWQNFCGSLFWPWTSFELPTRVKFLAITITENYDCITCQPILWETKVCTVVLGLKFKLTGVQTK